MASAAAHAHPAAPGSAVPRPRTLIVSLPNVLQDVVSRKEFLDCLCNRVCVDAVKCVQTMSSGVFRVTFMREDAYDFMSCNGLCVRGMQCSITAADFPYTFVKLFRCPVEVSHEAIGLALAPFGKIFEIKEEFDRDFPTILTGTKTIRMQLSTPIPSRVHVKRYPCNIWYRGQPKTCRVCHAKDHEAPMCPLKGKCLRCHQAGHMAKNCRDAWGTVAPVEPAVDISPPDADTNAADSLLADSEEDSDAESGGSLVVDLQETEAVTQTNAPSNPVQESILKPSALSVPEVSQTSSTATPSLVDEEGFVIVQSRAARQKAAKELKQRAAVAAQLVRLERPSRSRTQSVQRARSRSRSRSRMRVVSTSPRRSRYRPNKKTNNGSQRNKPI